MEQTYLKLQYPDKKHTSTPLPITAEHFLNMIQVYLWYSHVLRYSTQTPGISLEAYKTVNKSHFTLKTSAFYTPWYKRKTLQDSLFILHISKVPGLFQRSLLQWEVNKNFMAVIVRTALVLPMVCIILVRIYTLCIYTLHILFPLVPYYL